jgi:prepilin-type N-terminal cleavage/methylation domain-containing protein
MIAVGNSSRRGYTLIEVLIALVVFAILLMMAGPAYMEFIGNAQIRNAGEALLNGVRLSQSEALKHNLPAIFTLDPSTGYTISIDDPENPGTPLFQRDYLLSDGSSQAVLTVTPQNATVISFDGLGRLKSPNDDGSQPIVAIDVTHASLSNPRNLRVVVANTASGVGTMLCDPATSQPPTACP